MSAFAKTIDTWKRERGPLRIISASGQLGYGIPEPAFRAGVARRPHLIGADMGPVDPGPYYLGAGKTAPTGPTEHRHNSPVDGAARSIGQIGLSASAATG